MPQISVIVPVYNAEKTLHRCVDSILAQTFTDFELLLINDGSTDGSGRVCDEYAAKDARIRVFHKENGGVSSARNVGLDEARGEWIAFCDSDDEFLSNALIILSSKIDERIDFISTGYLRYAPNGDLEVNTSAYGKSEQILDARAIIEKMYQDSFYQFYVVTKMFRKEVVDKAHLRFDERVYFSEDKLFIVQYICAMQRKSYYTVIPIYIYSMNNSGAMQTFGQYYNEKSVTGLMAALKAYSFIKAYENRNLHILNVAAYDVLYSYIWTRKEIQSNSAVNKRDFLSIKRNVKKTLGHFMYWKVYLKILISGGFK